MAKQKFHKGDHVRVVKNLGPHMSHFSSDCEAVVIGSYKDQFGGSDTKSYTLFLKDQGEVSWYDEHQLILIQKKRLDLLKQWESALEADNEEKSDLDWIFSHGEDVLDNKYDASVSALGKCLGIGDMWGSRGEGIVYFCNSLYVLLLATPYLKKGDKKGWLNRCVRIKKIKADKLKELNEV